VELGGGWSELADCGVWLARAGKTVKRGAMSLLIRHARILTLAQPTAVGATVLVGGRKARRGAALKDLGVIARGDVLVTDGKIAAVGAELAVPEGTEVIEADGRVLMPGFVDCHTHACWAGDRLGEWEQELSGVAPAGDFEKRRRRRGDRARGEGGDAEATSRRACGHDWTRCSAAARRRWK